VALQQKAATCWSDVVIPRQSSSQAALATVEAESPRPTVAVRGSTMYSDTEAGAAGSFNPRKE